MSHPRPLRIFLLKPYQPCTNFVCSPPIGLLSIISSLRERFQNNEIEVRYLDAKVTRRAASEITDDLAWADVIGMSALNFEAHAVAEIAQIAKSMDPKKITVLGGPYAHHRAPEILDAVPAFDWVFDGESEYSFPEAIARTLEGKPVDGIAGLYFRDPAGGRVVMPAGNDFISELDKLPFPAWDLVDFDLYTKQPNMNAWMKGKRYAVLFTSRGCPYKCAYCHDIFTKKFRMQSPERVLAEMDLLINKYGVNEFQIVDDIFNLHKPRVRAIMAEVVKRYGKGKIHFCFPNGLRGDILDRETVHALKEGGAYQITLAVETVTPRLQTLIQKNLKVDKVAEFIRFCHDEGIIVKGFFMLGFPTETREELWNTIKFAWKSKLSFASFFTVVPQPGTPLHALAKKESPEALAKLVDGDYYDSKPWYTLAYGYPLGLATNIAYLGFYFEPLRFFRLFRQLPFKVLLSGFSPLMAVLTSTDVTAIGTRLRVWLKGGSLENLRTNRRYSD